MIVDQHRAVTDPTRTSSDKQMTMLTRREAQFLKNYRQCSAADQDLIFRALSGDDEAMRALEARQ